ncbi:MAG: beta-N-acetylhexosaminidase, partial [Sediminibacterium sp.]|nr:beta-N-acetylhexosaminidase [Sediminibacterium sp.]
VPILNRGISGDYSAGVLNRLPEIYNRKPDKVFLLIGVNDLTRNISPDSIFRNISLIAALIHQHSPKTTVYVQSIFPVNEKMGKFQGHTSKRKQIVELNDLLRSHAPESNFIFLDVFSALADSTKRLHELYTNDGLHLTGAGYQKWKETIEGSVYGYPALLPYPAKVEWNPTRINIADFHTIQVKGSGLSNEVAVLTKMWSANRSDLTVVKAALPDRAPAIQLILDDSISGKESYYLSVQPGSIIIKAKESTGIFYGIQTLQQLKVGSQIQCATIWDKPAFQYRGFMLDVGRNYQSIPQIKSQIDVMAAYKLNVFHFHVTEDIAWRLESKQFPQLIADKNMLRNPGKWYSYQSVRELIQYCKDRKIQLIPEIDMPGHSAAFKRAMGVDMQSDSGIVIVKKILAELVRELAVPVIHIGGDEVKIVNTSFLPEISSYLKSLGKQVMAWNPGGNVPEGTMLQMWVGTTKPKVNFASVDSRHLYLNHLDPIDGVVTTFNHVVCDTITGSTARLGAELCNWPDRKVAKEEDLINMNAVYPVMLSFAERTWRGGGWKNFLSDIGTPGSNRYRAFVEFEQRLLEHKATYFAGKPFPYVAQSHINYALLGPFQNDGKTTASFEPERATYPDTLNFNRQTKVYGGTIWLRHFWSPMIGSHLEDAPDSSTYYAVRKIWSNQDGVKNYWIGFNNISRSPATDSPPLGEWDIKHSKVWVNGLPIAPPEWKQAGMKGNAEMPLMDEGYEYRKPTSIYLHKGWNTLLIKAPVGTFKGEWQNPVKWMFTFLENPDQ